MKKNLLLLLIFVAGYLGAQQDIYKTVSEALKKNTPKVVLENKILVINFSSNPTEINKVVAADLEKTANVFQAAKLKDGRKGVICVSIVPNALVEIMLDKEGYKKTMKLLASDLGDINVSNIENIIFNANGDVLYKNIEETKIYTSVQKLITR